MIQKIKINASASIEFVVVVSMLFTIMLILVDVFLLFRQIYLVQAFNDEVFTRINMAGVCSKRDRTGTDVPNDTARIIQIISEIPIIIYFNDASQLSVTQEGNNFFKYENDRYRVNIKCKNDSAIESALTTSFYNGLFMFKNKNVSSGLSSTLSYY